MRRVMTAAAAAIGALAAACGSGPAAGTSTTSGPAVAAAGDGSASGVSALTLRTLPGISAKVLVGARGRALYLFGGDRNGLSRCSGACATAWPPYLSSQGPKAGMGVNPALLGTLRRPDGTIQVTYNGHPLYYYQGDMSAGSDHGQGMKAFGAQWYLVAANGSKISKT